MNELSSENAVGRAVCSLAVAVLYPGELARDSAAMLRWWGGGVITTLGDAARRRREDVPKWELKCWEGLSRWWSRRMW